ncbi:DUF2487 family protein [Paenibacillus flagellatus]|uniref:DUF2487 domain-containing protein n=1 Tax=Paenibacillus flagellatus TaxID=2211139 RepID=A0A2V5KJR7_9BACL|nr:DUF2487 family protein [Paenibacillus flagellatus]PYI54900.1 DUF2487 domain-containing protein [Paenibacillus flagellatus]
MKFSDIERSAWEGLKPYLDTCLLPVTGLSGFEQPWEATQELEYLRDVMDCVEGPFKGRIVTYPAFHYIEGPHGADAVNAVCCKLKAAGFRYVIVITGHPSAAAARIPDADLLLCPEAPDGTVLDAAAFRQAVNRDVQAMWQAGAAKPSESSET